jgi:Type IV secretion-system coupling protein DNA-binding domain
MTQSRRERVTTAIDAVSNQVSQRVQRLPVPDRPRSWLARHPRLTTLVLLVAAAWLAGKLLGIFVTVVQWTIGLLLFVGLPIGYFWIWLKLFQRRKQQGIDPGMMMGLSVVVLLFAFYIPFAPHLVLFAIGKSKPKARKRQGRRGTELIKAAELRDLLLERQAALTFVPKLPLLEIAGIEIPSDLENLGFFFVGSPGSGKTQAIKRLLAILRERSDFRVMVLDRNGELLESFYQEGGDLLFNPKDARSLNWNHVDEGMEPETIAAALVPDDSKEKFFSEAAKSLLADLYERCRSNQEVWEVISTFSMQEIEDFLAGGVSARYFGGENTGSSVLSTLVNEMRFYRRLVDDDGFSFSRWGREDDPRWLFCTVFEDDAELFKPLYSMAFELMLKGLLSHPDPEGRRMKTAIVVDELGALNQLRSLSRLLSEARKFGGTAILGTQTEAQIDRNYGELDRRVILQGTCTKLILNCRDGKTAEVMADLIGKQERIDITRSDTRQGLIGGSVSKSEQIREVHTVMPGELQSLPPLEGYLTISDGTPAARVKIEAQGYGKQGKRFVAIEKKTVPPVDGS